MTGIYVPAQSTNDWRQFLADPEKQWCSGYSARERDATCPFGKEKR